MIVDTTAKEIYLELTDKEALQLISQLAGMIGGGSAHKACIHMANGENGAIINIPTVFVVVVSK